ncbi:MAG TPA: carboxypeptidase-like regulatory domain-containing protein, partial [Bryobacteraceae bacterium]|nr:carboxypeptidase-like regulatory domain-containing protein [Bryobacteraceae bacterium]
MRQALYAILAIAAFSLARQTAFGQAATGTIIGHVTDSSGAAVQGVVVVALNPEKGISARTVSDEQGIYRIFYLDPAAYKLTFEKPGFAVFERNGVELRSNDTLTVDTQLQLGNLTQKVEVDAVPPMLETATSTTGTVLSGTQMNALPIMQRYTWMTMYLTPGVTSMNGFHIAGQRDRGIGFTMDGI